MKIINQTQYDTRYLRKVFLACEKHCFELYLKHSHPKYRKVTVKYHRQYTNGISGRAWLNSSIMTIELPNIERRPQCRPYSHRLAQVYLHELGHNLGLKHKQMRSCYHIDVSWLTSEPVPFKQPEPKSKPNVIEVRAARAKVNLVKWQKKLNRAKTGVKKYQTKVRYYEKKMAANK